MSSRQIARTTERRAKIPATTWVGTAATALLAIVSLASTGFWGMMTNVTLALLVTVLYGVAFRRATWLRLPRRRAVAGIGVGVAFVVLVGSTAAFGATHPELAVSASTVSSSPRAFTPAATPKSKPGAFVAPRKQAPTPTPVVVSRNGTESPAVPFSSQTVQDAVLPKGTSKVTTTGRDGVETKVWRITTTDGVETGRTLVIRAITVQPTPQITSIGTYLAPAPPRPAQPDCTNGSYVNSAGNRICRPIDAPGVPADATAQCRDGVDCFSQSRQGTCLRHGGVATWF